MRRLVATDGEMVEDIRGLYEGIPAAWMTIHIARDQGNRWSRPTSYRGLWPLPMGNTEPFGPGASAGGDESDIPDLVANPRNSIEAGFILYVFHPRWGVFNGEIDLNGGPGWDRYTEKSILDHHNIVPIMHALRAAAEGGTGPIEPPTEPGMIPDRGEMNDEGRHLEDTYRSHEGLQRQEGLWIAGNVDWEGAGAWLFDIYLRARVAGWSREDARAEYVRQIRHSEEWQQKHPGEIP